MIQTQIGRTFYLSRRERLEQQQTGDYGLDSDVHSTSTFAAQNSRDHQLQGPAMDHTSNLMSPNVNITLSKSILRKGPNKGQSVPIDNEMKTSSSVSGRHTFVSEKSDSEMAYNISTVFVDPNADVRQASCGYTSELNPQKQDSEGNNGRHNFMSCYHNLAGELYTTTNSMNNCPRSGCNIMTTDLDNPYYGSQLYGLGVAERRFDSPSNNMLLYDRRLSFVSSSTTLVSSGIKRTPSPDQILVGDDVGKYAGSGHRITPSFSNTRFCLTEYASACSPSESLAGTSSQNRFPFFQLEVDVYLMNEDVITESPLPCAYSDSIPQDLVQTEAGTSILQESIPGFPCLLHREQYSEFSDAPSQQIKLNYLAKSTEGSTTAETRCSEAKFNAKEIHPAENSTAHEFINCEEPPPEYSTEELKALLPGDLAFLYEISPVTTSIGPLPRHAIYAPPFVPAKFGTSLSCTEAQSLAKKNSTFSSTEVQLPEKRSQIPRTREVRSSTFTALTVTSSHGSPFTERQSASIVMAELGSPSPAVSRSPLSHERKKATNSNSYGKHPAPS